MNDMMFQATQLTRANRLIEATALIQRMLRGETDSDIAGFGDRPPTIDGYLEIVDETKPSHINAAPSPKPHYFQAFARSNISLRIPLKAWTAGLDGARTVIHAGHRAGRREVH